MEKQLNILEMPAMETQKLGLGLSSVRGDGAGARLISII